MPVSCTICGLPLLGWPDADVTCTDCDRLNLAGDPLRRPERPATPLSWWTLVRGPLAPHAGERPSLHVVESPWTWREDA